jgi:hypothetical protein
MSDCRLYLENSIIGTKLRRECLSLDSEVGRYLDCSSFIYGATVFISRILRTVGQNLRYSIIHLADLVPTCHVLCFPIPHACRAADLRLVF